MKQLLKPTWAKVLLTLAFSIIPIITWIKSWDGTPPKPPLYDLLMTLPLDQNATFLCWLYLILPMIVIGFFLSVMGVKVWAVGLWLQILAHGAYFYLLASVLISSFNRYSRRFPKWLWVVILLAPVALYLVGTMTLNPRAHLVPFSLATLAEEVWVVLPLLVVGSLYMYLLFCLGFFIYDAAVAWGRGLTGAKRLVTFLVASIPSIVTCSLTLQ